VIIIVGIAQWEERLPKGEERMNCGVS
jgi:hypothetical protein